MQNKITEKEIDLQLTSGEMPPCIASFRVVWPLMSEEKIEKRDEKNLTWKNGTLAQDYVL